jgi:hypothetical protein
MLGVVLLKLTAKPDVAVAETVPVPPTIIIGAEPKLTDCEAVIVSLGERTPVSTAVPSAAACSCAIEGAVTNVVLSAYNVKT